MTENLIQTMIARCGITGWAVDSVDVSTTHDEIRQIAAKASLSPVPVRRGEALSTTLRPMTKEAAPKASLSAQVGLGEQPLHTDGAHLEVVPDYLVLWCASTSPTATRFWNPTRNLALQDTAGLFLVRGVTGGRFVPARDTAGLRFDPGCMEPADGAARELAAFLQAPPAHEVHEITWDSPGKIVLINNRQVLHGRAAIADGDTERALERMAFTKDEA